MLDIIPVLHPYGQSEYRFHPPEVDPTAEEFLVPETTGYLINVLHNRKNFERAKVTAKNRTIFCDSGGLQLGVMGPEHQNMTPTEVMRWMNENCTNGFVVDDLSVFRKTGDEKVTIPELITRIAVSGLGKDFQKCAENTARNLNEMLKVKDSKVKLFGIIQGYSTEQLDYFLKVVQKDHELDGFGLKAVSPTTAIENLAWAWDNVHKPLHILGVGKMGRTYPLIYWSTKFKQPMTGDSTTNYSGAMFRKMFKAMGDLDYSTLSGPSSGIEELACVCPVCRWGTRMMREGGLTQNHYLFAHILSIHNWNHMIDDHVYASALAKKPMLFREHAETFERVSEEVGTLMPETVSAVDVVDAIDLIHDGQGALAVERYVKRSQQAEAFF